METNNKKAYGITIPRHDTAINWSKAINFTPKKGELIVYDADTGTYDTTVEINGQSYPVKSSTKVRFKFGDGESNVNVLPFATTENSGGSGEGGVTEDEIIEIINNYCKESDLWYVNVAKDGESIIIGDGKDNFAGTKGFIIEKAQRVTQENGTYKYYYILRDSDNSLLNAFQEVLASYPQATYTLRLYHLNNNKLEDGTYDKAREYADDYGKTYSVGSITIENKPYLKVEVDKVKRTYKPVPDSGNPSDGIKDEEGNYRYAWKQVGDSNVYEIDYTDTYELKDDTASDPDTPAYSYFRLSVAPELGTNWLPTHGLVAGGSNNKALGKDAFTAGSDNISNGSKAMTLGDENYANYSALAAGKKNKAMDKYNIALGHKNEVNGWAAFAAGELNEVTHSNSAAIGKYLKTHNGGEAVVGGYNIPKDKLDKDGNGNTKGVALSVGAGWSEDTRRDAMTVYRDGTTKILGHLYSGSTDVTQTALDAKTTADTAKTNANNAKTIADTANTVANEAKDIANQSNNNIEELENKTILQLGNLPEMGEINKLYIDEQDEPWIYKVRKTPKAENVWDGSSVAATVGSGTESDPYIITNAAELHWAVGTMVGLTHNDKYYKLVNDIYINDITVDIKEDNTIGITVTENTKEWFPDGTSNVFYGHIDGDNHTVYGLYVNTDYTGNDTNWQVGRGLIPRGAGTVKNLGIEHAYVSAANSAVSAFIGTNSNAVGSIVFENCYVGEDVYLSGSCVGGFWAGGAGDRTTNNRFENCYCLATIVINSGSTPEFWGALTGQVWSATNIPVTNCYTNTRLYGQSPHKFTNCYSTTNRTTPMPSGVTKLDIKDMQGINALDNMPNLGDAFINDYTYPHLKSFAAGWKNIGNNKVVNPDIVNYLEYEVTDGEVTITGYKEGLPNDVVIPNFIDGYSVTRIGNSAFSSCTSLTSITIPDSVVSIGSNAFSLCYSLTSITISNTVTSIGDAAFSSCTSLTSITIPDSVVTITPSAFLNCTSLTSVTIGSAVTRIGERAFYANNSLADVYYKGSQENRNNITISSYNDPLLNATWHYNYSFDTVYDELNSLKTLVTELQSRITELENK